MRRAYIEAHVPLREAFIAACKSADAETVALIAPSTSAVEAQPWLESAGVAIGTTSNRHSRFSSRPHGAVIGWCLNLGELLEIESRDSVASIVAVQAHASHAPWVTANEVERLAGDEIPAVPEATNAIKAMVEGISMQPVLNHGLSDSRERSTAIQALTFIRARGHELRPQQLIVEAIRQGWPGASPLDLANLARDLNRGKQLRYQDRLNVRALEEWSRA